MKKVSLIKFSFLSFALTQSINLSFAQSTTPTWSKCASENGVCSFTGKREVRYGANGKWVTKTFTTKTDCSNAVFGDPVYGVVKSCEVSSIDQSTPPPTTTWTTCANENATCSFTGTREVRYGANSSWVTKTFTNSTACSNAVFGDPIYGVVKTCQYSSTTTTTPPPTTPGDNRRVLKVCSSGCSYTLPSQAIAASLDNDIIEVAAGTYSDCFFVTKNNITLRGVNGRAYLKGKMCGGKGAINTSGENTTVENFEFSDMYVADRNGAGIRHQGLGLVVKNSYFHDGENGILSGRGGATDPKDTITIENSKFEKLGGDAGHAHGVYFGNSAQVTIKNSVFLSSREEGHEFKSRAMSNNIECSIFAGLDGVDSYSLNFPDAGAVVVKNSVIEQGPNGSNSNIIDYGSEMSNRYAVNTFNVSGVTVINDLNRGTFFNVRNSTQFTLSNATIVGPGGMYSVQSAMETNVVKKGSRSEAGLNSYPSLPLPTGCSGTIGLLNN